MKLNKIHIVQSIARQAQFGERLTSLFGHHASRSIATSNLHHRNDKIYEMRHYDVKLDAVGKYKQLCTDLFHLRTAHSKLCGFWFADIGSKIGKAVHIWEYNSLSHRSKVRAALDQDKNWQENFVPNLLPLLQQQENSVMYMPSWCSELYSSQKKKGIYELMTYTMVMGGPVIWGDKLKSSIDAHRRLNYSDLIGVWYTDIGDHNTVQVLWRYDTFEMRHDGRERAHGDAVVVNKVRDNLQNVTHHNSVIMLPASWSPMQ